MEDKLKIIKDMLHNIKYDTEYQEYEQIVDDLQVQWLVEQVQYLSSVIEEAKDEYELLQRDCNQLSSGYPQVLKVKNDYITKLEFQGNQYTIIHPTKRR